MRTLMVSDTALVDWDTSNIQVQGFCDTATAYFEIIPPSPPSPADAYKQIEPQKRGLTEEGGSWLQKPQRVSATCSAHRLWSGAELDLGNILPAAVF